MEVDVELVYVGINPLDPPVIGLPVEPPDGTNVVVYTEDEETVVSVIVNGAVRGKDVVVTPVANGTEDVLVKPTGELKLEFADGVMDADGAVERYEVVVGASPVTKLLGKPYAGGGGGP